MQGAQESAIGTRTDGRTDGQGYSLEIDISSLHRTLLRVGTRANERRLLTLSRSWATTCYHRLSFPMSFSFAAAPGQPQCATSCRVMSPRGSTVFISAPSLSPSVAKPLPYNPVFVPTPPAEHLRLDTVTHINFLVRRRPVGFVQPTALSSRQLCSLVFRCIEFDEI